MFILSRIYVIVYVKQVTGRLSMNITIIGRKCNPREPFKERAELKLSKVDRLFGPDADAKIVATAGKKEVDVEVTVSKGGYLFRAQERSNDIEEALDKCVDSLIRQIRKNKTRLSKRLRSSSFDEAFLNESELNEDEFEIVRTKEIFLRPESEEEAMLQLNMLGHSFHLFRNSENDEVNLIYKRKDGGYGLIIPTK